MAESDTSRPAQTAAKTGKPAKGAALATGRSQHEFTSIDSAPRQFAGPVAGWRGLAVLVLFVCLAAAGLWTLRMVPAVQAFFPAADLVLAPFSGSHSVPLRLFFLCYFIAFSLFSKGTLGARLGLLADLVITFLATCSLIDLVTVILQVFYDVWINLTVIEILSGLVGYALYSFKLMERGTMPERIVVDFRGKRRFDLIFRLIGVLTVAGVITFMVAYYLEGPILWARNFAMLGGVGPGVLMFLPLTFLLLYSLARLDNVRLDTTPFSPPLTVIVPAHNEMHILTETIHHIDEAAARYGGSVQILIMDNNSTDSTHSVARAALAKCVQARGRVIEVKTPGKAHALNAAIDATETEFVIRIDADTQVGPDALSHAMLRMRDPEVGVVGGLPIPPGGGLFDRARMLELLVKHGFYSVGLSAVNSVVGVPGMFALYRTDLPRQLGGFVQGMNGEDTDMSLRIGELGYKLVVDPRIQFISEVPATYAHMREQRMRWFRSVYHISARCRDLIYSRRLSVRGKVMLPFMLVNSALRAMMVPLILFGVLLFAMPSQEFRQIPYQAILAVMIGAPACLAAICVLINGMPKAILYLPEYLVFRVLRAYFTLESNLSIILKGQGRHLYSRRSRERDPDKALRDA